MNTAEIRNILIAHTAQALGCTLDEASVIEDLFPSHAGHLLAVGAVAGLAAGGRLTAPRGAQAPRALSTPLPTHLQALLGRSGASMYHDTTRTAQGTPGNHRNSPACPGCRYDDLAGGHLDAPSAVAAGSTYRGLWDYTRQVWGPDPRPVPSIAGR